jgi:D-amino-acid dehydrogenase
MKVLVVGAGVNGLFIAYNLLKRGHRVELIDRNEFSRTSQYNAGLLTPSLAPTPKLGLAKLISAAIMPRGFLYFSPSVVLRNGRWLAMAARRREIAQKELVRFGLLSLEECKRFIEEERIDADVGEGVVALYKNEEVAESVSRQLNLRELNSEEVQELGYNGFEAGVMFENEISVNPHKLFAGVRNAVLRLGGTLTVADARGFLRNASSAASLVTSKGSFRADIYVLSTGAWSDELSASLGFNAFVLPARGLAVLFETRGKRIVHSPALFEDYGTAVNQHNPTLLRATSFFELNGFREDFGEGRLRWMMSLLRSHMRDFALLSLQERGVGFRPCTPDQLPVIGKIPGTRNVFIATGHCRLGMTLAAGTGKMIADQVEGKAESSGWACAFEPSRFSDRKPR